MSEITPNLNLVIPSLHDPNEPFNWQEFLHNNFKKIDNMAVLGETRIVNSAAYVTINNELDFDSLLQDLIVDGRHGLLIYFPPGVYYLENAGNTSGPMLNFNHPSLTGSVTLIGARGAVLSADVEGGADNTDIIYAENLNSLWITGLTLKARGATDANTVTNGIRVKNVSRVYINDVQILDACNGIVFDTPSQNKLSEKCVVTNCVITNYHKNGIDARETGDLIVKNNNITREGSFLWPATISEGHAIKIKPGTGDKRMSYIVTGNIINSPRRNGVEIVNNTAPNAAVVSVIVDNNTINEPGNHPEPDIELDPTTRGSGVHSNLAQEIEITNNRIFEPLSYGILCSNAVSPGIIGNDIRIGDRNALEGKSWSGIRVVDSPRATINSNRIRVGTASQPSYNGQDRNGIDLINSNWSVVIANNVYDGTDGIYIYDSDRVVVNSNLVYTEHFTTDRIVVAGETSDPATYNIITSNITRATAFEGIKLRDASDFVIHSNIGGASYPSLQSSFKSIVGDARENDILDYPNFEISKSGMIERGYYRVVKYIPVGAMHNGTATFVTGGPTSDDPAILFDANTDIAYVWVDVRDKRVNANEPVYVDLFFSGDSTTATPFLLGYVYFSVGHGSTRGPYTDVSFTVQLPSANTYMVQTVTVPGQGSGWSFLGLRIKDNRTSGSQRFWLHGIRLRYIADYDKLSW